MTSDSPRHVDRADDHVRRMFDWMLRERFSIMKALDVPRWEDIDLELAKETFEPLAFKAVFNNCLGESQDLVDETITQNIWSDVMDEWPEIYYMELYVKAGIAFKFEDETGTVYGLKERHSEELSRLLTANSTEKPS
jgi:hypothetical protein